MDCGIREPCSRIEACRVAERIDQQFRHACVHVLPLVAVGVCKDNKRRGILFVSRSTQPSQLTQTNQTVLPWIPLATVIVPTFVVGNRPDEPYQEDHNATRDRSLYIVESQGLFHRMCRQLLLASDAERVVDEAWVPTKWPSLCNCHWLSHERPCPSFVVGAERQPGQRNEWG